MSEKPTTRRSESAYATRRRAIRLIHLKVVDLIKTDDELEFLYKQTRFSAIVERRGYIRCERHAMHSRADFSDANYSYYRIPSNYANDCVTVYWATQQAREACSTNPSGYERVRHVATKKTLNQLRDEYMQLFGGGDEAGSCAPGEDDDDTSSSDGSGRSPLGLADYPDVNRTTTRKRRRHTTPSLPPTPVSTPTMEDDAAANDVDRPIDLDQLLRSSLL